MFEKPVYLRLVELGLDTPGKAAFPRRLEPMLPVLGREPFTDPNWLMEAKWDGIRTLAFVHDGVGTLRGRGGRDLTGRFYPVANRLSVFPTSLVVDGEMVVLDEHGRPSLEAVSAWRGRRGVLSYKVFDCLYLHGHALLARPLDERRRVLEAVQQALNGPAVQVTPVLATSFSSPDSSFAREGSRASSSPSKALAGNRCTREPWTAACRTNSGANCSPACAGSSASGLPSGGCRPSTTPRRTRRRTAIHTGSNRKSLWRSKRAGATPPASPAPFSRAFGMTRRRRGKPRLAGAVPAAGAGPVSAGNAGSSRSCVRRSWPCGARGGIADTYHRAFEPLLNRRWSGRVPTTRRSRAGATSRWRDGAAATPRAATRHPSGPGSALLGTGSRPHRYCRSRRRGPDGAAAP